VFSLFQDVFQLDIMNVLVSLVVSLPCLFLDSLPPRLPSGQELGESPPPAPTYKLPL
jgi:hypothetical protein